jgi:hypothetical protein
MTRNSFADSMRKDSIVATLAVALAVLALFGCAPRINTPSVDSQSHWLQPCNQDAQCGEFSCLCGVCSSLCSSNAQCNEASGVPAKCAAPDSGDDQCAQLATNEQICVQDCSGGDCTSVSVIHSTGTISLPAAKPVPQCPELARTSALPPLFFTPTLKDYDGPATVNEVRRSGSGSVLPDDTVVLVPNNLTGEHLDLRFNTGSTPSYLPLGQRVHVSLRGGGESNAAYTFMVLRDDTGKVLLAFHSGMDQLLQAGVFATRDTFGATVELRMLCQSAIPNGCFDHQVQADYAGTFGADTVVTLDNPDPVLINMNQLPYELTFSSNSVDGGAPNGTCAGLTPGRYLNFILLAH